MYVYSIYFSCCLFLSLMIIWVTVCLLRGLRTQNNWIFCKHHLTFKSNCFQKVLISRSVRYKMKKSQELNWYLIINCDREESVQVLLCDLMSLKLFFLRKVKTSTQFSGISSWNFNWLFESVSSCLVLLCFSSQKRKNILYKELDRLNHTKAKPKSHGPPNLGIYFQFRSCS